MNLRCMIVEDEPLALKVLNKYIQEVPQLLVVETCTNAIEAMAFLQKEQVDLIFLDINLPKLSGINFIKSLSRPPMVIFVTAYPEHAVEGFDLAAVDYLLKPYSFDRFLKAVNRAFDLNSASTHSKNEQKDAYLLIKSDKKWIQLAINKIDYLSAYGDYIKVYQGTEMYLVKEKLKDLQKRLPASAFFKIHRSHVIRLNAVNYIEGNMVYINNRALPLSARNKETLLQLMGKREKKG